MAINTLTVIPGIQLGANDPITVSAFNQAAKPTVLVTLTDPFNDENYFRNGNMYAPFWTTPAGLNCPAGSQTTNAQYWYVQPNGSGNVNCLEDNTRTPDLLSLYSAKLVGATGITDVLFFQQISSDLSATLRRNCTVSGWIYNGTTAAFTPTLQVATANAINNFATVTVAAELSFPSCPAAQWTYVTLSQDLSVYSNVGNGLQLSFHFPSGVLNASTNSVNLDRLKIQPGTIATAFADDITLFTSIPTIGTTNIQNQAVTAAKIANNTVGVGQLDPTCGICPTGSIIMYGNALSVPSGWLGCNGAAVNRTTYANLFSALTASITGSTTINTTTLSGSGFPTTWADGSAIQAGVPISGPGIATGTTIVSITASTITLSLNATGTNSNATYVLAPWGVGDGSTTFNTPDMRGKVPVGHGTGTNLTARQVGQTGGEEKHALTIAELAAHTHGMDHYHPIQAGQFSHYHVNAQSVIMTGGSAVGNATTNQGGTGSVSSAATLPAGNTDYASAANASYANTASVGSGNSHNTMQPYGVVLYIIKT